MLLKKIRNLLATLAVTLLLTSCAVAPDTTGTRPTVEDLFVPPIQTVPTTDAFDATNPKPTGPTEPTATEPLKGGGMGWRILGIEKDENGYETLAYTGGEMSLPLHVEGHGIVKEYGIGILLFVDGKPQPYRTTENEEYKYVHSFTKDTYPVDKYGNITMDTALLFTPVAGKEGEYVRCYLVSILHPDFSPAEWGVLGSTGHKLTSAYMTNGTYLRFEADPPQVDQLPVEDRLVSVDITNVETTHQEVSGWTSDDMLKLIRHNIYVNDRDLAEGDFTWDVTEDTEITVRFEVWGSPYINYNLIVFVDNQPVSVSEEDIIEVFVESGKKTVITAKLDNFGFDGERHLYCVLVPLNKDEYRGQGIRAGLTVTRYTFLFDDPNPKG